MTKKRMINEKIEGLSRYEFVGSFESIEKKFQEIRAARPQYESFSLDLDYEYDDYGGDVRYAVFTVYGQRPETAEDRKSASAKRAQAESQAKAQRQAQFEKLKEEFGG